MSQATLQYVLAGVIVVASAALGWTLKPSDQSEQEVSSQLAMIPGLYEGLTDTPEGPRREALEILRCTATHCFARAWVEGRGFFDAEYDVVDGRTLRGKYRSSRNRKGMVEHHFNDIGTILDGVVATSDTEDRLLFSGKSRLFKVVTQQPLSIGEALAR